MPLIIKQLVERAQAPAEGQIFIRDSRIQGFALRVISTGAKSFIWEGRVKGRVRRITLGRYPDLSVAMAREEAQKIRGAVAQKLDPSEERQRERRELTFKELADLYMERHAKPHKDSWKTDQSRLDRHVVPRIGSRRLSDISTEDIARLQQAVAEHGEYESNRTIVLVRTMFNIARHWKLFAGDNPAVPIKLFKEEKRERFLNPEELIKVNKALASEPNDYWRAYFPLVLLLGTRKREILNAKWSDIDFEQRTWRIPDTKADRPHLLPIPTQAMEILKRLPSHGTSKFVFPSPTAKGGHIVEPSKAWQRIRNRAAGHPDGPPEGEDHDRDACVCGCTIHDLRRTLGSWLAAQGIGLPVIGKALNHRTPSSTAVYARLELEPVRIALERNARLMLGDVQTTEEPAAD